MHSVARSGLVFAFSVALLSAPSANAVDTPDGGFYVGFAAGAHIVLDDWDLSKTPNAGTDLGHGGMFGVRLGFHPAWWLGLETSLSLLRFEAELPGDRFNVALVTGVDVQILTYRGAWVPFISAGVGGYHNVGGQLGRDNDFNLHYGVGLKGMLNERWAVRVDVQHLMTDGFKDVQGGNLLANNLTVLVGLDYFITRKDDTDRDGLRDDEDECPKRAGPVDSGGCPDTDGDGLTDNKDRCPAEPGPKVTRGCPDIDGDEVADKDDLCKDTPGHKTADGCPDRDGDRVADSQDRCPDAPGALKDMGCPKVQDTDNDGIVDIDDACPKVKGAATAAGCPDRDGDGTTDAEDKCPTKAGPKDEEGCPDTDMDGTRDDIDKCPVVAGPKSELGCLPEPMRKFAGRIEGIHFSPRSAKIQKKSHEVLNQAVKILKQFPKIQLEVQGHTDNNGKPEYNRELSNRRAISVMEYLVAKGIAKERLKAKGYGDKKPQEPNNTPEGRALNRRIEFKVTSY